MASLIEELIGVLEAETGCYETLLNMADNKTDVIINGDVPSLQEITKKEQELAGHILRLEKRRKQNLEDICEVLNKKIDEMTVQKLIELLPGPEKEKLQQVNQRLVEILSVLKQKNDTHKMLIQESIDYIDFTMNAVQSMSSAPMSNSYAAKGNMAYEQQGKNFFDAKQ